MSKGPSVRASDRAIRSLRACTMERTALTALLLGLFRASPSAGVGPSEYPEMEQEDESARVSGLPTVSVTVTVRARAPGSTAQSVAVIERETIEAAGARTLADVLDHVPGVYVSAGGGRGALTTAQIRGGDPNMTLVLVDGAPLNDGTDPLGGVVDLESIPAESIERVEVARGPLSFYHGTTALAGVVNVITRGGSREPQTRVALEGGDASLVRSSASFSNGFERGAYRIGMAWDEENGRIGGDRFQQLHVDGKLNVVLSEKARAVLSGRFAHEQTRDYPEASGGPVFGSGELRVAERDELSVSAELELGRSDAARHRLIGLVHRNERQRESPGVLAAVPPSVEETHYTRGNLTWASRLLSGARAQLDAGVDVDHERGLNESSLQLPLELGGELSGDYALRRTTPGIFAELILGEEPGQGETVPTSDELVVELGGRVDLPETTGPQWSPRAAAFYRFRGTPTKLRASIGRAFKLPSFFALASPRALGGNPDLAPESSWGAELGVEHELRAARARIVGTLFYVRFGDLIDFDFESFEHVNRSRVRSWGAEISVQWSPHARVRLDTQATWNEVEDLTASSQLLHRPRWVGSAQLLWNLHACATLWLDARAVSKTLDRQLPVPGRNNVPGYGLLGLAGSWRFAKSWELRGRVDNLTDHTYETFIGFPAPGVGGRLGLRYTLGKRQSPLEIESRHPRPGAL